MKNYNQVQRLVENHNSTEVRIRIISDELALNEALLGDFLRVAKDKYFSTNINLSSDDYNKYKYAILETFLKSFDEFKFKKLSISNFFFKPKEILKDIKSRYLDVLKAEYENAIKGTSSGSVFGFKNKYGVSRVSLLADIIEVIDKFEKLIKEREYEISLNRVYKVESLKYSSKKDSYDTFLNQLRTNFFEIFDVTNQKYFRYSLANKFLVKNKFQEYMFRILKIYRKKNIDSEYIFVNDDLYQTTSTSSPIYNTADYVKDNNITNKDKNIMTLDLSVGYINDVVLAASRRITGTMKYVSSSKENQEYFKELLNKAVLKYTRAKGDIPPNKETYVQILVDEFNLENPNFKYEVQAVKSEVASELGKSTDSKVEIKKEVIDDEEKVVDKETLPFNKNEVIYSMIEVMTLDANYINDSNRDYFSKLFDIALEEYKEKNSGNYPSKQLMKQLLINKFQQINPDFDIKKNNNLKHF